jgi:hypothetical protein
LSIRTVLVEPLVVLVEVVNAFDALDDRLQLVLDAFGQTAEVLVELRTELGVVLVEGAFDHLADCVEDARDVEADETGFKTHFVAGLLEDNLLALVLFVRVVQFGDLPDDPEGLSVQLLLQVRLQDIV